MSDEIMLRKSAERGARAQALLDDDLLKEAFATLTASYKEAWENTQLKDTDSRERLWQAVHIVGKIETHLKRVLNDGKLAQHEINQVTMQKTSLLDRLRP